MYANQYPSLYRTFPHDNFEVIAETLETYFSGLFDLQLIENEIKENHLSGSYINFFGRIVSQLAPTPDNDLYTSEQVCTKIYSILQTDQSVRDCFLKQLIFVPPQQHNISTQLGFQEKLATGKLKVAEPITYLDMLRITFFLEQLNKFVHTYRYDNESSVEVIHLASASPAILAELKTTKRALMVNLNLNPNATPKWAVIDLRDAITPQIYCETPLLMSERSELEKKLGTALTDVSPGKADSLVSTGYSAIAWLDQHITKGWNFDTSADFNVLFGDFALTVFRSDVAGIHFSCIDDEYDKYFTKELKYINDSQYGGPGRDPIRGSKQWGSFALFRMVGFATLDEIEGEPIPYNDLAAVIHAVGSKRLTTQQFEDYSNLGFRSKIPRFAHTLTQFDRPPVLQEDADQVTLTVPYSTNYFELSNEHTTSCKETRTDYSLLRFIKRDPRSPLTSPSNEDIAAAMVLTLFRARAKKPMLTIDLPVHFNLNASEQRQIVKLMQDNAFVTELHINEDNQSLLTLKTELIPTLARNRWLATNNYLPPFVDNYWQRAAKYWLVYLNEHVDLLDAKEEHLLFKRCVEEMGIKGLRAALSHLSDPELRERILGIYGKNRPTFYLACPPREINVCLDLLIDHLSADHPFPYAALGVAFQPGSDAQYLRLLSYTNARATVFEKVQLADCLKHRVEFEIFLNKLVHEALKQRWTGLIVIPELENEKTLNEENRSLRNIYHQLNNVILHNCHLKLGEEMAARIKDASQFDHPEPHPTTKEENEDHELDAEEIPGVNFGDNTGPWPLQRGGVVQLQLQQQQEIQQNRQIQQEHQKMQMQTLEEVITSDVVTYDTIDALLGSYYRIYSSENACDPDRYAPLWDKERESLLQGFFHTWVNANPRVNAPQMIRAMTQEAAKMLLRHHVRVTSGLNLANLPKGFYTQRAKDGGLILCYNPDIGFASGFSTPLTPLMQVSHPNAIAWEGDFRLFNIEHYLENPPQLLNAHDFQSLVLFEKLQPTRNYQTDYDAFCHEHPDLNSLLSPHQQKIIDHWLVFMQTWQYAGEKGIEAFLALSEDALTLDMPAACDVLFSNQSEELVAWIKHADLDEKTLQAIGQVYYRYGNESVGLLLTKFKQIEVALGEDFFKAFNKPILGRSNNYNSYLHPAFFKAMDDMITHLSPAMAAANRQAWLVFYSKHLACVPYEAPEAMWSAFDYFIKELADMGLQLSGTEFDNIEPQNMLVGLDRILATLRCLPEQDEKTNFLKNLDQHDLTQGGVHYAIQYERFKYSNKDLLLSNFAHGTPTYSPDLNKLYSWEPSASALNIKRTLASHAQLNRDDYLYLSAELAAGDMTARHHLVWLLFTQVESADITEALTKIRRLPQELVENIAHHLHQAVYRYGHPTLAVSVNAIDVFQHELQEPRCQALLARYPHGNFLEALSILADSEHHEELERVLALFVTPQPTHPTYPEFLYHSSYKLATLFGAFTPQQLAEFIHVTSHLKLAVQYELDRLIQHLLSVNYRTSDKVALYTSQNWTELLSCIQAMNDKPTECTTIRKAYITKLCDRGITFKYSKSGEFRHLTDADYPPNLNMFTDHQQRLWDFLKNHIVVSTQGEAIEALRPLLAFFQRLQLNRTYLNEVEPLLAILEKTSIDKVWSAHYFSQMLDALKPDNDQASFPLDMLQVMLKDEGLKAKPIDNAENNFPTTLVAPLKGILRNTTFSRPQQAKLCELALKEFQFSKSNVLLGEMTDLLSPPYRSASRDYSLDFLINSSTTTHLTQRLDKLRQLLTHPTENIEVSSQWDNTVALWLKAVAARSSEIMLLNQVMASTDDAESNKRALILHIIAWSSLHPGLRDTETYLDELTRKAPKLATRLLKLSADQLTTLAACYPKQPSPGTGDLIQILKLPQGQDFNSALNSFLKNPHSELRIDYQYVVKTRQADLQRMLTETRVTDGHNNEPLSPIQVGRLSLILTELKQLENGHLFIEGTKKAVADMGQQELAEAFKRLSIESLKRPNDDTLQAQIWALLFEALGRTTRKYPHMAQQVALITNDIAVDAKTRVLRLSTGEGKSHFVALRAARHAALGKVVDVCTAKRSLAERDLMDYQDLFKYLGFTASCIQPKSSRDNYINSEIHYSTLGDLSLFLDEQRFNGKPVEINPKNRVGLLDELDFIYFDEGRKTEYNYARPTGRTPKQMIWFYQAINEFYLSLSYTECEITQELVCKLAKFLAEKAGEDENKALFVAQLTRDGLQLVNWLQSAHEAHQLEKGVGFTVLEENIQVGDAIYLVKEIIPLSSDNQRMTGSTFSAGVHELLAVRLNSEAKTRGEAQNFHVHAESHIISSQVAAKHMRTLWEHWEGFTGTVSAAQAHALNREQNTKVLQVSTNHRDLRNWHAPSFYQDDESRLQALVMQLRRCMEKNQSILFSCKNDQHVLALKEQLENVLTPDELDYFIFYTNEDKESSSDILIKKQQMEDWQGGEKQHAAGLVASGFGRGDNVGVEAVFLFDVSDINDLQQKGGRTARNGEDGEVFQFYLNNDLATEEAQLLKTIQETPGVESDHLMTILKSVNGASPQEQCFNRVMLLREYVFTLQNSANQGYRAALAQFSGFGMQLIGSIVDPTQRYDFTSSLTHAMHRLNKQWLTISSHPTHTPTEKVRAIEEETKRCAHNVLQTYKELLNDKALLTEFQFEMYPDINLTLTRTPVESVTQQSKDLAILGSVLASLPMATVDRALLTTIPGQFDILTRNAQILHEFTRESAQMKSAHEFLTQLAIRVTQITHPPAGHQATKESALETPDEDNLFAGVSSHDKASFIFKMSKLTTALQDKITAWQKCPGFANASARVEQLLPLITYLGTFSQQEQHLWGDDYLEHLEFMWISMPSPLLAQRLSGHPMSFTDNESLWQMASNNATPGQEGEIFQLLQKSMGGGSPAHRLRMQTRCEGLVNQLPQRQKGPFLIAFNQVMAQFHEGKNWGIFVKLVERTTKWWNLREGAYRTELQTLWFHLAANNNLSAITDLLDVGLNETGKSWFQSMLIAFKHISPELLCQLQKKHWQMLPQFNMADTLNPHFTAEGRQQSIESFDRWLWLAHWSKKGDVATHLNSLLPTYRVFLQTLITTEPTTFNTGAKWYLDFVQHAPASQAQLDVLVTQPERRITLQQLMNEFTDQRFNDQESAILLRAVVDKQLDEAPFSQCCQALSVLNQILMTTSQLTIEEKSAYHHRLLQLPSDKLLALLPALLKYQIQLKANPCVLDTVLGYGESFDMGAKRIEHLTTALLQVVGPETQTSQALDHLILGVNRFQRAEFSDADIGQLLLLTQGQGALATEQVLFDNIAHYLNNYAHPGKHQKVKQVIDWFYRTAKTHRGDVEAMQKETKLAKLFDFENSSKSLHNQRVIWMHLLNHNAFVTGNHSSGLDTHAYQWSNQDNQTLLQHGLDLYIGETKKLLARRPTAKVSLDRDLSIVQQRGLLQLADELAIIGTPQLHLSSLSHRNASQANIDAMKVSLGQLVGNYQSSWFKSESRKNQFAQLQHHVLSQLENRSKRTRSRYEEIINVIRKARVDAMRQDIIDNQTRYFMLNSSSHSRYFSTLNQMEDLIVRHWVQDPNAVQSFQNYKKICNKELLELAQQLHQTLNAYHMKTYLYDVHTQSITDRISHWFTAKDKPIIEEVLDLLLSFNDKHINNNEPLSDVTLSVLNKALHEHQSRLPGHVRTLAKEVIMRSHSLITHLGETNDHPTKRVLTPH